MCGMGFFFFKAFNMNWILIPLMTALFAWILPWIMVKSLFYPKKPMTILGFIWEGSLLKLTKHMPIEKWVSPAKMNAKLDDVMPFIDTQLDEFFRNRLKEKMPIVSMFIGDKTIHEMKSVFLDELRVLFPNLIIQFTSSIQFDLVANFQSKASQQLEKKVLNATLYFRCVAIIIGLLWGWLICYLSTII